MLFHCTNVTNEPVYHEYISSTAPLTLAGGGV